MFTYGTHIKANTDLKKQIKKAIPGAAKAHEERLMDEINTYHEKHGTQTFKDDEPEPPKERILSL